MKNHSISPNTAKTQLKKVENTARWLAKYIAEKMTAEDMIEDKARKLFEWLERNGSVKTLLSISSALQGNKKEYRIEPYIASTYNFTQQAIKLNSSGQKDDVVLKQAIEQDCRTMIQAVWDMKNDFER